MLRLIIADDERVMREMLCGLIDWPSLDIEVIGMCEDGIEAYNMILDENPDIAITDIRMPGLSGIELAREVEQLGIQTQFILLSGYEEFDYAREAMRYGVKHYLLKPCDEVQISESIRDVSVECYTIKNQKKEKEHMTLMMKTIRQDAMYHLLSESVLREQEIELPELAEQYSQYFDFYNGSYELYYLFNLEQDMVQLILNELRNLMNEQDTAEILYGLFVQNTLILFGRMHTYENRSRDMVKFIDAYFQDRCIKVERENCPSLLELLNNVMSKVKRYHTIYVINNYKIVPIFNQYNITGRLKDIYQHLEYAEEKDIEKLCSELEMMIENEIQTDFLKLLISGMSVHFSNFNIFSISETSEFMKKVNQTEDVDYLKGLSKDLVQSAKEKLCRPVNRYGALAKEIMAYVKDHISDSDLTLKNIAEQYLYMNVDYVSKQFQKASNKKFSQYLMEERVSLAKELLLHEGAGRIQYVAEQVGYGNNPRYFTQIFKKVTGITPSWWLQQNTVL